MVTLRWLETFYFSFFQNAFVIMQTLSMTKVFSNCVNENLFLLHIFSTCYHILFIFNQNKCDWKYLQCTKAKVLLQYGFILLILPILILRKLYVFAIEMIQICCTHSLKEVLEITTRNNLKMTRSSEVSSDSSIVGCEYTIQFYAISFLKEDTVWLLKKVKVLYPISPTIFRSYSILPSQHSVHWYN